LHKNKVCYASIKNPTNNQLTIDMHNAFESGSMDSASKWHVNRKAGSHQYFTVYPSGMCDPVSFSGERCPEYNHKYVVDPVSGSVEQYD
jgi:hypothetical protein